MNIPILGTDKTQMDSIRASIYSCWSGVLGLLTCDKFQSGPVKLCGNLKQIATQIFFFFIFVGKHSNMTYQKWDKIGKYEICFFSSPGPKADKVSL